MSGDELARFPRSTPSELPREAWGAIPTEPGELREYLFSRCTPEPNSGCWLWLGGLRYGYGFIWIGGQYVRAHRLSYELNREPISSDTELDHKCRVRCCINPDHLRPLDHTMNTLIGIGPTAVNSRKAFCEHGHPFSGSNLRIRIRNGRTTRVCRKCNAEWNARDMRRRKGLP